MEKFRTVVLWWLINEERHPGLSEEEMIIKTLMPILSTMFPGINYYSITGFSQVMNGYGIPALKSQFPDLVGMPAEEVDTEEMREISEVLASKGYEWQDSEEWQTKFTEAIAA